MESVEEQRQHLVITSFTEDRLVRTNRMKVNLLIWSETSTECKIFQDRPFGKWGGGIHFRRRTGQPSILLSVSAVCSKQSRTVPSSTQWRYLPKLKGEDESKQMDSSARTAFAHPRLRRQNIYTRLSADVTPHLQRRLRWLLVDATAANPFVVLKKRRPCNDIIIILNIRHRLMNLRSILRK